ncbi:MAG TPA: hypothetical protein VEX15_12280 [Nocardioidaceae bacterium]|nr:hypothetical protein [Nocardioidaceae bacterium]
MTVSTTRLPIFDESTTVVSAPGAGPGNWAGAPSAVWADGAYWLAYRVRRPLDAGRGVAVVVAHSTDGVRFEPRVRLHREDFGAESFERPALTPLPTGGWRLYLSCATPHSKHWWVEAIDAPTPDELPAGRRHPVLAGDAESAFKDPVVVVGEPWQMWVCRHPLDVVGSEDRMSTWYATSDDGLAWRLEREVLRGRDGMWDARGARVTTLLDPVDGLFLYDGRATVGQNWYETTGLARQVNGRLNAVPSQPTLRSPFATGAFRYVCAVDVPGGGTRFYFEAAREDGAHDLRTVLVAPPQAS